MEKTEFDFASTFPGANTEPLHLRISKALQEALETARGNRTLPDFVREILSFNLVVPLLESKIEKGMEINESDRATLEGFRKHIDNLDRLSKGLDGVKEHLATLKEKDRTITEAVNRTLAEFTKESRFNEVWNRVTRKKGGR